MAVTYAQSNEQNKMNGKLKVKAKVVFIKLIGVYQCAILLKVIFYPILNYS